jgi:signal peptidase I
MRTLLQIGIWTIGLGTIVLGLLYYFAFDVWTVPSDDPLLTASIEPTLSAGDLVVLARHPTVARGILLRCPDPQAEGRFVVARAIAESGDEFKLEGETIHIDGHRVVSPHGCLISKVGVLDPNRNEQVELGCATEEYGEATYSVLRSDHPEPPTKANVEAGKWYLVSDDRHVHLDSRDFGQVDPSTCQHVVFRLVGAKGWSDWKSRLTFIW